MKKLISAVLTVAMLISLVQLKPMAADAKNSEAASASTKTQYEETDDQKIKTEFGETEDREIKVESGETEDQEIKTEDEAVSNLNTMSSVDEITEKLGDETPVIPIGHNVYYETHVQNYGWQGKRSDNSISGTSGEALRLEAIRIRLGENISYSGSIEYRTHVQNIGWQDYVSDGVDSGTSGRALRLEAIQIRLTGEAAKHYDVYYRVHAQNVGWMGWAKNGNRAGTAGYAYRLEAIQIRLVAKSNAFTESTSGAYLEKEYGYIDGASTTPHLSYSSHVQNIGWQAYVSDGNISGTSGLAYRLEGIKIKLINAPYDGTIEYCTHIQNIGWQDYKTDNSMSGTSGLAYRLEAIRIRLTDEMAEKYDVYYCVHAQNIGWMSWAKNGEISGTAGLAYRLEAIKIVIQEKGASAPATFAGQIARAYVSEECFGTLTYQAHLKDGVWQNSVSQESTSGTTNESQPIDSLKINVIPAEDSPYSGDVEYAVYDSTNGWSGYVDSGQQAGVPLSGGMIEAFRVRLTGDKAVYCDIYYRAYVQNIGWLPWACNDEKAGTIGAGYRLEAFQICVKDKKSKPSGLCGGYTCPEGTSEHINMLGALVNVYTEAGYNLRSCYNWIVKNVPYTTIFETVPEGYTRTEWFAYSGAHYKKGSCYQCGALMAMLAKGLGYNAQYIEGKVPLSSGDMGPHGWCQIVSGGQTYIIDPHFEQARGKNGYMFVYGTYGTWKYTDGKSVE